MKQKIKKALLLAVVTALFILAGLMIWSNAPIKVNPTKADPAVILANEIGKPGIAYEEGYAGKPGSRIHYVSAGQGEAIIFVHGFPSYWFDMFGMMEAFKSDYHVIAIDGLGVGKSDAPNSIDAYNIENLIKSIEDVIQALGLDKVHLVGHDWGVALTAGYAQAYPLKVKSLTAMSALPHGVVLSRTEYDKEHQDLFSYTSSFARANPALIKVLGIQGKIWNDIYAPFVDQEFISEEEGERFYKDVGNPRRLNRFIHWYRANFPEYDKIQDSDFWPARNTRLTVPTLFIYGENDPVVTDPLVNDFKNISNFLTVIKLDDVGHRPHMEAKDKINQLIREFLEADPSKPL